jgi:AcrR family transcriptional regulator
MAVATNDRTRRILDATCSVVARKGAHALRMSDVAREAAVSNALLHYYFETRTELLAQAFAFAEGRAYARTSSALEGLSSGAERLREFLRLYVGEKSDLHEDWILWNEVWSSALFDEALRPSIESAYADWVNRIVELAREASGDGSISAGVDVEASARRLAALVDGLGSQRLVGLLDAAQAERLLDEALELELGLTSRTPAARA